jgi:phospho-N-acetylmuramoyl-pentapeptide-transferase
MLYLALFPLRAQYPVLNVLRYETFRSVLAGLTALALSLALGPLLIQRFRAAHIGQTIREEVPLAHRKKAGTPTMGGLLIVASCLVATVLLADPRDLYVWLALFVMVSLGAVGFIDDYLKLRGNSDAHSSRLSCCSRSCDSRRRSPFRS